MLKEDGETVDGGVADVRILCRGMVAPDDAIGDLFSHSPMSIDRETRVRLKLTNLLNWHIGLEGELGDCAIVIQASKSRKVLCYRRIEKNEIMKKNSGTIIR